MSFIIDFEKYYRKKKGLMSAEEEARYDSEQASKQLHEKWKQEEENGSASSAMETSNRFENWMQNSQSLSSAYAKDATSRNYMNKTSAESSQFMLKNLADQAAKLQLDLEKNRSYLGDDYVSKAMEYIRVATGQNKAVSDALTQKQDILSRFKDQTEYERAVKDSDYRNMTSEERLAEAERLQSSNKAESDRIRILDEQWNEEDFLAGKSYDQIKAEEKDIEQQILDRRNRISEMMYSVSYYDSDEKKQQIQQEQQQIMEEIDELQKKHDLLKQNEYYVKMDEAVSAVPEDMQYWLEKEAEYRQSADAMNSPFDFIPAGSKLMNNKDEYAEAIRRVEQYAKENGQDIDLLKDYYTRKVNAEEAQVHAENMEALSDNVFGAIAGSVYSVPANLFGGLSSVGGTIGNFVSNLFSEDYVPIDRNSKMYRHSDTADLIRGNVAENLGDVGGFLYQTGMSMADSLAVLPLNVLAPGAGSALLGTAAASSSIRDTLDRGGTTGEALANGIFAGVAETIFEKVSLDSLFKLKNVNSIKDAVTNIAKQSFTEGSEEFFTEISNRITDEIVMADKSAYNERIKELVLSGMSEEKATKQADSEFVQQLATSFAGGALSGAVFGGGKSTKDYLSSDTHAENVAARKETRAQKLAEKKAKQEQKNKTNQTNQSGDPIQDAATQAAYREIEQNRRESAVSSESPVRVSEVGERAKIETADGNSVSPERVTFSSNTERQLYERATTFDTANEANAFINNYDGKTNVESYYEDYSAFSKAAKLYDSYDAAIQNEAYQKIANRIGESTAKSAFISTFNTQNNITVSQQERAEIQKTGGVIRNYSVKPSRSVSMQIDALEIIGKKYGLAIEAVNTIGGNANGFYDPNTKRIVVALDADEGGIVRVASHELYHHIENVNPADAAQIRSVVISALKSKSDYDYEAQKKWLMSKGYSEADVDSEIVAQSMFDVLNADTIEKLRNENPSLLKKIKNWIDSFFKVLEDAIDRLSTKKYGGAEIRALRNDKETLSKVRKMMLDALEKDGETQLQEQDVQYSLKDIEKYTEKSYNNYGWVVVNDVLSEIEYKKLNEQFASIRRGVKFPKTRDGYHVIAVGEENSPQNKFVFIKGTLAKPVIHTVMEIDVLDEFELDYIREWFNERTVDQSCEIAERMYFPENVRRTTVNNFGVYRTLQGQAKEVRPGIRSNQGLPDTGRSNESSSGSVRRTADRRKTSFSVKDDSDVDTKALMRENEHLKKMLDLARRELKRTKGHQVKPGTFENLANRYKRRYGSRMETAEIASALQKMYDYIANGEEPNAEVAFDMAADIARDIVNQSKLTSPALLQETKAVRDHLRNTAVYFPENVRSDINYSEIKSSLFGRLKIRNDGLPVDTYLAEMKEIFPEYADLPAESSAQAAESLLSIVDGVYTEYVAATSEDIDSASAILASDIFNDYFDVPEYKTFADRQAEKMRREKQELRNRLNERSDRAVRSAIYQERERFEFEKKLFEKEIKEKTAKGILDDLRQKRQNQKEQEEKRVHIRAITRNTERIMSRYLTPTNKRNIPNVFKQTVADVFKLIDFGDITFDRSQNNVISQEWKSAIDGIRKLSKSFENNDSLSDDEKELLKQFLDPNTENKIKEINTAIQRVKKASGETVDISKRNEIDSSTLKMIREITENVVTAINNYGESLSLERKQTIQSLGEETIKENSGKYKSRNRFHDFIRTVWMIDSADINTFLTGLGESGKKLYNSFRSGDVKRIMLIGKAKDFVDSITKKAIEKDKQFEKKLYSKDLISVSLDGKEVNLTKQQILSLYMLSKRSQALQHMIYGDGIIVGKMRDPVRVTMAELQKIFNDHLSNVDREFATKLQEFLSTEVAEWGNEITRKEFGYDKFTEEFYFPIDVYENTTDTKDSNVNENSGFYAIRNFDATKSIVRNATNALKIENAMDVFADHITKMSAYNGFALQIRDAMAWFNYRSKYGSVKRAMNDRYGDSPSAGKNNKPSKSPSISYFENWMMDLNRSSTKGQLTTEKGIEKAIGRAKATMVSANLHVAIQQPTAIIRSFYYLDPKFFVKPAHPLKEFKEATQYSGAAKMKGYGFYENALSPQLATLIKGDQTIAEKIKDKSMILAEKADEATWGIIWSASKQKALADNSSLVENSAEHLESAGKIMDEVCYNTQVFDSILTQTGFMRSKNGLIKPLIAFTSEPAKFQNMILRASYTGKKSELSKTILLGTLSNIMAAAAASVIDAFRDDDDYKTWLEKYMDSLSGNIVQNLNVFSAIPLMNDAWNLLTGNFYSSSGVSYSVLTDAAETVVDYILKIAAGEEINMNKVASDLVKTFSTLSGIPLSNAEREVRTLWNTIVDAMGQRDLKWRTSDFYVTKDSALYEQLYQAQMNNDQKTIQRVMQELESRDKTDSQIKTGLKNVAKDLFTGEIEEAAKAKNDGDTSTYERMLGEIQEQTPLERKDVQSLIDNAAKKLLSDEEDAETEQEESKEEQEETEIVAETDYSTTDIVKYVIDGGYSSSTKKAIDSYYSGYYDKYIKEGKTEKEAASKARGNIKSAITRYYKPIFIDANAAERDRIKTILNEIRVDGKKIYSNDDYKSWKEE